MNTGSNRPNLRRATRRAVRRLAAAIAARDGLELVERGRGEPGPAVDPETEQVIPRHQLERFETAEYEVVPKGRYDVVLRDYYSPIPDLDLLPDRIWERRAPLGGLDLRLGSAIELIEGELKPFVEELEVPRTGSGVPGEFFLENENYESVDAELLYALIRSRKPRRIIELGSGFTTLLISLAARRNAAEGEAVEHLAYDPFPRRQIIGEELPEPTRFRPVSATDVPLPDFEALEAGDVLFVDTTHTVKLGSDVNFIVLEVLPALAPGVLVHFHDIFLPWEYPKVWFDTMRYYWAEQYLLQAFLAFNRDFEVVLPAAAVAREEPTRLRAAVPSFTPGRRPGAFWLVRS